MLSEFFSDVNVSYIELLIGLSMLSGKTTHTPHTQRGEREREREREREKREENTASLVLT